MDEKLCGGFDLIKSEIKSEKSQDNDLLNE